MYMNNADASTGTCRTCFTAHAPNIIRNLLEIQAFVSCGNLWYYWQIFSSLRFADLEFSWSSFSPLAEICIVILWTFCMLVICARYSCILTLSLMISV